MAVIARATFPSATRADHDRLLEAVAPRSGPDDAPGLHLVATHTNPEGGGFGVLFVFEDEGTLTTYVQGTCLPAVEALGLEVGSLEVAPVWSLLGP